MFGFDGIVWALSAASFVPFVYAVGPESCRITTVVAQMQPALDTETTETYDGPTYEGRDACTTVP